MAVRNPPNSDVKFFPEFEVTDEIKHAFDVNGYIIVRGLLDKDEVAHVRSAIEDEEGVTTQVHLGPKKDNSRLKIALWNQPGNDVTGIVARTEKVAGTFEKLLGGEVYHYHAKVIMKEAHSGGAHLWHQDYGYWYENGCVFPHMGTAWIAIDKADKENGCMQVLQGSQRAGRITHHREGEQAAADLERVAHARTFFPLVYVETQPGDCLFFHCNLLHSSDKNESDRRRWAYLCCYNRADNNPVCVHHHPQYTPLHKVPNSAVLQCKSIRNLEGKDFFKGFDDEETHMALSRLTAKPAN